MKLNLSQVSTLDYLQHLNLLGYPMSTLLAVINRSYLNTWNKNKKNKKELINKVSKGETYFF